MLRAFLRKISIYLSFTSFKRINFDKKRHDIAEKIVKSRANLIFKKNSRLKTHQNLSNEILKIIGEANLIKFLRNHLIQKIFFVHNRFFIFFELRELKKDKNWNIWKKLLKENDVGGPIKFFLYPQSSGNRIRQVFIIKKFIQNKIEIKLHNLKNIIEIGGGYGCMADIFKKIDKNVNYTIYDMHEVNLLQYYYLFMNKYKPTFSNRSSKLNLISEMADVEIFAKKNKDYLLIANWSISEFPIELRKQFYALISNSKYSIISFQEKFENIDNKKFFDIFLKDLKKKFDFYLDTFDHYNSSYLNNNKHFILTLIRK